MLDFMSGWSLSTAVTTIAIAAATVAIAGWRMAKVADALADRTGLGEAVVGALLLGAATSLPGIVTSAAAASHGYADMALSNALGGIAVQTLFLCVGDVLYRKSNLEHAAASLQNILQATLLLSLLVVILMASYTPRVTLWGIHPATPLLLVAYVAGQRMIQRSRGRPMWQPEDTAETQVDVPQNESQEARLAMLWFRFVFMAIVVGVAGWLIEHSAVVITQQTNISQAVVGGLVTAIVTSLPELVTTIAAVRNGALTLAVGGILGGNAFDTLFAAVADGFYREGSLYHAASRDTLFLLSITLLLTAVLLMGLVRREKFGIANIGFESILIIVIYACGFLLLLSGF